MIPTRTVFLWGFQRHFQSQDSTATSGPPTQRGLKEETDHWVPGIFEPSTIPSRQTVGVEEPKTDDEGGAREDEGSTRVEGFLGKPTT